MRRSSVDWEHHQTREELAPGVKKTKLEPLDRFFTVRPAFTVKFIPEDLSMARNILVLVLILQFLPAYATANDDPPARTPSLTAHRTLEAISVDGHLDEADWQTAQVASDFKQFEPVEGDPSAYRTEVKILYSNNYLYVGAYLYDDTPEEVARTLGRRDDINKADWFMAAIDSYYDRKTAYTFAVNAAGIQADGIQIDGSSFRNDPLEFDTSWDAVWTSAVKLQHDGWSVEMRIPYSMLRFSESESQTWGVNFRRVIPRISEMSEWALVRREDYSSGSVANYGTLVGLDDIQPRRNIQVTPYTVSGLRREESESLAGTPINSRTFDVGGDLKIGITSNITLDATINPDFGQVESDPAVLNLTVYETFFEERRPFFVEGVQIFDYTFGRQDALLYTRRIGADAPIIGATKLSGRTDNGFAFGVLGALTGQNFNPTRTYGVGRVIQQIGQYSNIGGIVTAFDNQVPDTDRMQSYTGGLDWDLRFSQNRYRVDGMFSFTNRIIEEDSSGPIGGIAGSIGLDRTRGLFTYGAGFEMMSDTFNPRDMGVLRRNDQFRATAYFNKILNQGKPFGPFQRGSIRVFHWDEWSYDRSLYTGSGFFTFTDWLFKGFQRFSLIAINRDIFGGYDQFDTRGLFPRKNPYSLELRAELLSDSRRTWQIGPQFEGEWASNEGGAFGVGFEGIWNVGSRLSLESEVILGIENDRLAWASNEAFRRTDAGWSIGESGRTAPDELADEEFIPFDDGASLDALVATATPFENTVDYYLPIYGRRDNRSLDVSLRSNITFTKDLSLQIFSQLFVARGAYERFSILQNPDAMAAFPAYPKEHDFSVNSFLVNTVLRWEFRPGSTLFFVWSQSRTSDETVDPFNPNNIDLFKRRTFGQVADVFGLFPTNVFLIKVNYLFR